MLKKAGKDIPTKSGTKTNPKSQKEVPGKMLDKASKEIPTTSGTKSQIMMRLEKMVEERTCNNFLNTKNWASLSFIHTYGNMYDTLMRGTELCNRFNFIAASRINTTFITKNPTSVMNELVDRFMVAGDNTTPNLYFLPFNSGNGGHWKTVDAAILKFRSKKNYRNRKDITWVRVQCHQQNNSIDCGFFVLRFMRDIIALNRIDIPKCKNNVRISFSCSQNPVHSLSSQTLQFLANMSQNSKESRTTESETNAHGVKKATTRKSRIPESNRA
ncbi:hypothetical protein KIW84_052562 [Lathyrus oleraceus]|uniref:Ubiquitin-like protease family profile domain-containing protein n=1 Tax=Pisum sativum TaxID=3888 RepID=A0A9D4WQB5_PEA|nr:hypothetical protein KIW84_052562 [Pisum sativum]